MSSLLSQSTLKPRQSSPPSPALTNQLRQLTFQGAITLAITLAGQPMSTFYIHASRNSYLPLLLPQIRTLYLPLVSDEVGVEETMWFDYQGVPMKWHWPVGLLYDYHTAHLSLMSASTPASLASYFQPLPSSTPPTTSAGEPPTLFALTLHLKDPPTDALLLGSGIDICRGGFMNMVKEADYVRWGSVKRVTNLRKEQQDALWEGVVQNDYEKFWSVASKLIPLPSAPSPNAHPSSTLSSSTSTSTSSTDGRLADANAMRSVPMRVYLPEGAPVLQDVVPPLVDGHSNTLHTVLTSLTPLFFPLNGAPLARPVIHGIPIPLETEVAWLGACLAGADGWLSVVLVLIGR